MENQGIDNVYVSLGRRPVIGPLNMFSLLALAGMLGPLVLVIGDYTAAFTAPGYSIVRDSISSLALSRMGWLQTIGFLAIGLLVEIYVAGLLFNIRPRRGFGYSILLLVLFGFGLLMIGAFHTNVPGAAATIDGTIHDLAAKTIFGIFPAAAWLISFSLKQDPRWRSLYPYTMITVVLGILLIVAAFLTVDTGWFGLFERLLVANMIVWVEVTAIRLLRHSLHQEHMTANVSPSVEPKEQD